MGAEMETAFTRLVGCRAPVQQAPMGPVSTAELAVAVARAGGLGSITALGMPPERLESTLREITEATAGAAGAVAVNFLTADIDHDAVVTAARHARVIDFFWSTPDPGLVALAHDAGALAMWQVGSRDEALAARDAGCDLVAVQGVEAGGHVRGDVPLLPLLASVLDRVDVPVLAAGAIADGRGLAAVIAAGAAGARVGTRFLATAESGAHDRYKQAVVDAPFGATEVSDAFAVCPLCATSPRTRVLSDCVARVHEVTEDNVGTLDVAGRSIVLPKGVGLPPSRDCNGNVDAMAMYAGESAAIVDRVLPAADVVAMITQQAEQLLAAASRGQDPQR